MSSEVGTSLDISSSKSQRFLEFHLNDRREETTQRLFSSLQVCHDILPHSAAMNMAIDEALLQTAESPSIRFYQWSSPALSFGYFGKFSDVTEYATERDLVRRWTGGGIVFHGEDLTYSIVIPANDSVFGESSMSIYEKMHRALRDALIANAQLAELAAVTGSADAVACFANPVHADVMIDGRKVAGAAQRRTRSGLLQQGSIQGVDLGDGLAERFAKELSDSRKTWALADAIHYQAQEIAARKYGTESWLRKR